MPDATVKSHSDAWVDQNAAHKNWGKGNRLHLRGPGSGHQRQVFMGFARPFPHNTKLVVKEATLQLRVKDDWGGSHDVTVKRVQDSWKEHRITWTNAPNATDNNSATENVTDAEDGDLVEIDVTDICADWNLGADNFGFRYELDDDVDRTFYASDSPRHEYHPRLYVNWGFAPYPPVDLDPAGGQVVGIAHPNLQWKFADIVQENTQSASRVQIADDPAHFGSPLYDSFKQPNTIHRWSLVGEYTLTDGNDYYWRVQTWDDDNRASGWSDIQHFKRVSKGTLDFVSPGPSHTVDDVTPLISWAFSGEQTRARLQLLEILPDKTSRERWDSGAHKYTADHMTIPSKKGHKGPRIKSGHNYRLRLYVWDDEDRVGVSNDHAYAFAQMDFTYVRDTTPNPVSTLSVSEVPFAAPGALVHWTRATTPDFFCITLNGEEEIHRINPTDAFVSAGVYEYVVWGLDPREDYEIGVEAVEIIGDHNKHSGDGPGPVTFKTDPTGIWLIDDDFGDVVFMRGADTPDMSIGESGTTYQLVGNQVPVRIVDAIRGYEGTVSGFLLGDDARKRLLEIKGRVKEVRLVVGNLNIPVILEEITVSPSSEIPIQGTEEDDNAAKYDVTLSFFQVDDFYDADRQEDY